MLIKISKPTIILINGEIGAGKDTLAITIARAMKNLSPNREIYMHRFALKLKEMVAVIADEELEFQQVSELFVNNQFDFSRVQKQIKMPSFDMTIGEFLQQFATECVRKWDEDFWAKAIGLKIDKIIESLTEIDSIIKGVGKKDLTIDQMMNPIILIPDFRFPNEEIFLKRKFGDQFNIISLLIERPINKDNDNDNRSKSHSSENSLVNHVFTDTIINDGDLEKLYKIVCNQVIPKLSIALEQYSSNEEE